VSPRVVLIGPMGAGKSAVGALVAASLGLGLRDTDADVEAAAGIPVAEVFAREGEQGFRRREREAVRRALAEHDGVLSLGGGAVLDAATRADLVGHHVVMLDVTWEHVRARLGGGAGRPLLSGGAEDRWSALADARRHLYAEVAVQRVLTDGLGAEQVAARVLATLVEV
jgi:shikimate kinase